MADRIYITLPEQLGTDLIDLPSLANVMAPNNLGDPIGISYQAGCGSLAQEVVATVIAEPHW
jgi:hypothetical protein